MGSRKPLTSVLPTHQRRLRHLKSIAGRNLTFNTELSSTNTAVLLDSYLTLHADPTSPEFYRSETIAKSANPHWRHFDPQSHGHVTAGTDAIVARVWARKSVTTLKNPPSDEPPFRLLIECSVNFYGLTFVGQKLGKIKSGVAKNALVLQLREGYYMYKPDNEPATDRERAMTNFINSVHRVDAQHVVKSYATSALTRIHVVQTAIQREKDATNAAKEKIKASLGSRHKRQALRVAADRARLRVAQLKAELQSQKGKLQEEKTGLENRSGDLSEREGKLREALLSLTKSIDNLADLRQKHLSQENTLRQALYLVSHERIAKILQLHSIYPIEQRSPTLCSICHFDLPNSDFSGCDDETVANALGFVAHLTFMVAKYLDLPLRYEITSMCSRSTIRDDISSDLQDKARDFPLYPQKAKDRYSFEYGVFLLNKNIQQLTNYAGLNKSDLRNTLSNMRMLMIHFTQLRQKRSDQIPTHPHPALPVFPAPKTRTMNPQQSDNSGHSLSSAKSSPRSQLSYGTAPSPGKKRADGNSSSNA